MRRMSHVFVVALSSLLGCIELGETEACCETYAAGDVEAALEQCQLAWEQEGQPEAAVLWANSAAMADDRSVARALLPQLEANTVASARVQYIVAGADAAAGATAQAESGYTQALRVFEHQRDWARATATARTLGVLRYRAGDYAASLSSLEAATALAERAGDPSSSADALLTMAGVYTEVGNMSLADALSDRALLVAPDHARRPVIEGHRARRAGRLDVAILRFEEAIRRLEAAGDFDGQRELELTIVDIVLERGETGAARRHRDRARQALERALASGVRAKSGVNQTSSAAYYDALVLLAEGAAQQALEVARSALRGKLGPDWPWQLRTLEGDALAALGQPSQALAAWRIGANAQALEPRVRSPFDSQHQIRRRRKPFERGSKLAAQRGEIGVLLALIEQLHRGSSLSPEELDDTDALPRRIATDLRGLDAIAHVVTDDALVVTTLIDGAWSSEVIEISRAELGAVVAEFAAGDATPQRQRELTRLALGEAGALLGERPLVMIPDEATEQLPFAALPFGNDVLAQRVVVGLVPAFSAGRSPSAPSDSGQSPLFLSDAEGDLPAARAEATQWSRTLSGRLRVGASATTQALLTAATPLLHVSVHGSVRGGHPGLVFADDWISADAIAAQSPQAATVVLATCVSLSRASGDIWTGVPGAFLRSGSKHVVATLRSVNDTAARDFVDRLYRRPSSPSPTPADVTRAQRELIAAQAPQPAWAAFVSLGRPRPLGEEAIE